MAKAKKQFQCQQCGTTFNKWAGQCSDCDAWNTIIETVVSSGPDSRQRFTSESGTAAVVHHLADISLEEPPRLDTGLTELDRVLGVGLVPGSVVLLGGGPGVGKATLLLRSLAAARSLNGGEA